MSKCHVLSLLTELKKDGFGIPCYYECLVAEQLIDGQPSK